MANATAHYIFALDKQLLDLNALEMDERLIHFFETGPESDGDTCAFINDQGLVRKFKINLQERMLQGRGIKGFFGPYEQPCLLIGRRSDGMIEITSPLMFDERILSDNARNVEVTERTRMVLRSITAMNRSEEIWFHLYDRSRRFITRSTGQELLCLPHLRELEPYEYQLRTVRSVIERFKGRALLCDEVGLGKTVEAGIGMSEYIIRGLARKILILVPPSLVGQWFDEMKRKFNQDFVRADDPEFIKMGNAAWSHYNKIIASINTAKRTGHREAISKIHFDLVIVDEAHHLKNRKAMSWQFVNSLQKKYIFLLTATPVQNNLEELYNLITLLKPGQLKTYSYFKKNFVIGKEGIEVKNADRLKMLLSEVMVRNKRSNVDVKFTKRKAATRIVPLPDRERALYSDLSGFIRQQYADRHPAFNRLLLKSLQEQMGSTFTAVVPTLERLSRQDHLEPTVRQSLEELYQRALTIAAEEINHSAKRNELVRIIEDFKDKMIIFTKYNSTLQFISLALRDHGIRVAEFYGGMRRKEKEEQIAYFKGEAQILVSTEVGGEGRNLQFCNGLINFDLPWNPMAIEQRIGRIHRIGQERDVHVFNLAAQHTVEHYMLHVLDRKINMFELVVGEVDMILGDIEEEEEFSDLVMNAWVRAQDHEEMELEMDQIGNKLMENKQKLEKVKSLEEHLFPHTLE